MDQSFVLNLVSLELTTHEKWPWSQVIAPLVPTLVYKTSIFLTLIQIISCIPFLATFSFLGSSIPMAPTILIAMIQIWS
jgi:hypothetical protein